MTFFWTTSTLVISLVVMLIAIYCSWLSYARSGHSTKMLLLEGLRLTLIAMALITLNQPEYLEEIRPDKKPTLVVLYDTSSSMKTQDVLDPRNPTNPAQTRREVVDKVVTPPSPAEGTIESKEAKPQLDPKWAPLSEKMEVVFEPFSSELKDASQGSDLGGALDHVSQKFPLLRGIVLMSDGDWNTGPAPHTSATKLRMKGVPVHAVTVGSPDRLPDVELASVDAPTFGVVGKTLNIPFRILSYLPRDRDINVTLNGTQGEIIQKNVRVSGMGQLRDSLNWKPEKVGEYTLSIDIPVDEAEINKSNNKISFPITINQETLKVLIVESYPRWEYRYLRNALERDPGVDIACLLFHPDLKEVGGGRGYLEKFPNESELFDYDVVFLGDVGLESGQLTAQDCENLKQLVISQAGGLVFLPGFRGKQATLLTSALEDLYPVVPDSATPRGFGSVIPARFSLTEAGRKSLLTRLEPEELENEDVWTNLPGFQWYAATQRAKIGSQVLATHESETTPDGRVPLIVTRPSGTGKVLFMGTDGAWRWREGVEDLYHYRFWGQVVRWMAYQRNMSTGEAMRLFYTPERPNAGDTVTLNANVMSSTGEPLKEGTVVVQITDPSGTVDSVKLVTAGEDAWGLFTGTFTPKAGGEYKLVTTCLENGSRLETSISVLGVDKEKIGQPAREDVMKEIAEITRGQVAQIDDVESVIDELAKLPEPEPLVRRYRLWADPIWGGAIVVLLGVFWTARKLTGLA
ncbi:hypothetical protein [Lacunimicrobium album]